MKVKKPSLVKNDENGASQFQNLKIKNIDLKTISQKNRYSTSVSTFEKQVPKTLNIDISEKQIKENAYGLNNVFPATGLHSQTSFHKQTN